MSKRIKSDLSANANEDKAKREAELVHTKKEVVVELSKVNKELNLQIKERKQAEKALLESEERFKLLFEKAPLSYQSLDIDGNFIEVNQQWLNTLGYTRDEVIGKWFGDFLSPEYQNRFRERFPIFKAKGKIRSEFEMVHKNGIKLFIAFEGRIGYDLKGEFKQTHCILQDITRQKQWEDVIKKSEAKHSSMISNISDVIGIIGADGLMKYKSSNIEKWFGWKPQDLIGTDGFSNVHPDDLERIQKGFFTVLEKENSTITLEFRYKCKDGSYKPIELTAKNLSNDPIIEGVLLNYKDITERKELENLMKEKNQFLTKLTNSLGSVVFTVDLKSRNIEYVNNRVEAVFGYSPDECIGNSTRFLYPDKKAFIDYGKQMQNAIQKNQEFLIVENTLRKKNGELFSTDITTSFLDKTKVVAVITDITDKKKAEQDLIKAKETAEVNEEKFRNFFENSPIGKSMTGVDGSLLVNKSFCEIVGYSEEELAGQKWKEISYPEDIPLADEKIQSLLNGEADKVFFEKRYIHKNGSIVWAELSTYLQRDKQNKPEYFITTIIDITERKHADKSLRSSQEMLLSSQSVAKICSYSTNLNPTEINKSYWECSPEFYKIFGIDETYPHTIEGWIGFLHPEYRKDVAAYHESVVLEKKSFNREYKIIRINDGVERWVHGTGELVYDEKGNPIRMYGAIQDITERKQVELALKESEGYLEKAQTVAKTGHYIWDLGINILTWSNEMFNIYGLKQENGTPTPEEYVNFVHEEDKYILLPENMEMIIQKPYHELQYKIIDQSTNDVKHIYLWGETIFNNTGEPVRVIGVVQDITKQKNTEFELIKAKEKAEENEKQLKLISDNFVNGMIYQVAFLEENHRQFNYVSKNVEELYGCTAEEAKKDANLIYGKIHPDDIEGFIEKEKVALKNMSPFETEARSITPNGSIRWTYYISKPRIINGVVCWDGIEIDITERKQMELELLKAKEKAEESDRLKSAFLANMSHEIRTPMNGILGFSELLKKPNLSYEKQAQFIDVIGQSGQRMLSTINSIIDISKIESGLVTIDISKVNVNQKIESLHDFFSSMAESKGLQLIINKGLQSKEANISIDEVKFNSILTNLVNNAIKFTIEGSVEFGYEKKGEFIEFYVKDTGIGIPEDRFDAIFNRFVQADIEDMQAYQGSGLGLAISKSYVKMLGGKIWVESEEGKGTTFYFTLPYPKESKNETGIGNDESDKVEGDITEGTKIKNLKILVAEDDEVSYSLLTETLKEISSKVILATNGKEAINMCYNNPDIDLVIMDIKMPEMGGYEATSNIRQFNKDVVIIAQTAYGLSGDRERAIEAGCTDYVSKPIDEKRLLEIIRKHCRY